MKQEREQEKENQKYLRKLDKFNQGIDQVMAIVLSVGLVLLAVGNYALNSIRGTATQEQFILCCLVLLFLVSVTLFVKLMRLITRNIYLLLYHKDIAFDPATMTLPERGTVTLETALHKMSTKVGPILWDVILGCILFSIFFVFLTDVSHPAEMGRTCMFVALFIPLGHLLLNLLWKKISFTKKMLRNTKEHFSAEAHEGFADLVDASLQRGILVYEKELILTDDYLLGSEEWDTSYMPVAIPRARVTEYAFYFRRVVSGKVDRTYGILSCQIDGENPVNLVIGPSPKAYKILRIMEYYQIPWSNRELTYW